jgi:hypothetical protein
VPIVLKSGSLSLLEPSGPVKAYNRFALLTERRVLFIYRAKQETECGKSGCGKDRRIGGETCGWIDRWYGKQEMLGERR